jgi:hypothetical protein
MGKPLPTNFPGAPGWDIAFTRISRQVMPAVDAWVQHLVGRFRSIGLHCDVQSRHTPRGESTFLAAVGQRGLLFVVDITLIDGVAVERVFGAVLDVRLLDAEGDTVMHCSTSPDDQAPSYFDGAAALLAATDLPRCGTSLFVAALAHFGLVSSAERNVGA